ncbi:MAG: hypothetical protein NUW23_05875 [Firmicutes bacterium]|nr:hypothetical protein [Bacillota bacterium]
MKTSVHYQKWQVSPLGDDEKLPKLGIIADDLTGAGDAGVQFRKAGLLTTVLIDEGSAELALRRSNVVVLNTDSRHLVAERAYTAAYRAARLLAEHGVDYIYKKVDSTLRGNIGAEIDGVMCALGASICVLAPAFPANGRTTVDGCLLVHGVPLDQSEAGTDILLPAVSPAVDEVIQRQSHRKTARISLGKVRSGVNTLAREFLSLASQGAEIIVPDAVDQRDLGTIADAAVVVGPGCIMAGSAGLAAELPRSLDISGSPPPSGAASVGRGILVVVGSATRTSAEQVAAAIRDPHVFSIALSPLELFLEDRSSEYLTRAERAAREALASGHDVMVSIDRSRSPNGEGREARHARPLFSESAHIRDALACVARAAVASGMVAGIIVTGGDTAVAVCRALGAIGLDLDRELLPGIPRGRIVGGVADGMLIVTKAGSFGGTEALTIALDHLRLARTRG